MPENTSKFSTPVTTPGPVQPARTTVAAAPATGGTATPERSGAAGSRPTPTELVKTANAKMPAGRQLVLPSVEVRQASYDQDEQERSDFETHKQPFIVPDFSPNSDLYLGPGLTLIGAKTGEGKTSLLAAILAGFIRYANDTVAIVILNEENGSTLLQRVACILLDKSFPSFFFKHMPVQHAAKVNALARELAARIVVFNGDPLPDGTFYDTSCLEDVQTIIGGAPGVGANLVLGDYWQNVNFSRELPTLEGWQISKQLGFFVKDYGRRNKVPLGWFCQLRGETEVKEFKDRVENDRHLANHATNCIEIRPDRKTGLTTFKVWKQRWAFEQQYEVVLRFNSGRYVKEGAVCAI